MLIENSTPKRDHFKMAAEFETQQRSFMIWPERQDNWRNGGGGLHTIVNSLPRL